MDMTLLDRYAFRLDRRAYDHRLPPQLTSGLTLHASKFKILKPASEAYHRICPPVEPNQSELQGFPISNECLWVGMQPSPAVMDALDGNAVGDDTAKLFKGSIASMEEDQLNVLACDPQALRVVARVAGTNVRLFVLANPSNETGICEGHHVFIEDVFLFRPFLDERSPSKRGRRSSCLDKIRAFGKVVNTGAAHIAQEPVPGFNLLHAAVAEEHDVEGQAGAEEVAPQGHRAPTALIDPILFQQPPPLPPLSPLPNLNQPTPNSIAKSPHGQLPSPSSPASLEEFRKSVIPAPSSEPMLVMHNAVVDKNLVRQSAVPTRQVVQQVDGALGKNTDTTTENHQAKRRKVTPKETMKLAAPRTTKTPAGPVSVPQEKPTSELVARIVRLAEHLEKRGAIPVLNQCATILEDLDKEQFVQTSNLLGAALRIPYGEMSRELCEELHGDLKELFPNVVKETGIKSLEFHWLLRGLQMQGIYTLEYEMISPYVMAFSIELHSHFDEGPLPAKIKKNDLDSITKRARRHARALVNPLRREDKREDEDVLPSIERDDDNEAD